MSKIKRLSNLIILFILMLNTACTSSPPTDDTPLSKWTESQLITKGRALFEEKKYKQSLPYLREAAKKDNPEALYALGYMYYYGIEVAKNSELAQDLIRRSAGSSYEPAVKALRLFIASKSSFSANTDTATYLTANKNNTTNSDNKVALNKPKTYKENSSVVDNSNKNNLTEVAKESKVNNTKESSKPTPVAINQPTKKNSNKKKNNTPNYSKKTTSLKKILTKAKHEHTEANKETSKNVTNNAKEKAVAQKQPDNSKLVQELNTKWLNKQNPSDYTIQVVTSDSYDEVKKFIIKNHLEKKLQTYSYNYKGKTWFGAGLGVYNKPTEAYSTMLNDIPPELTVNKPWVRQFKNIQVDEKTS